MKKKTVLLVLCTWLLSAYVSAQTVYVSKTGQKYHNENCRTITHNKTAIELSDALGKGLEACKVCKPTQTLGTAKKQTITKGSIIPVSESIHATSAQCTAKTKAGSRCKRSTASSNGLCWQHGGN
ncbi:MAG: hypothetical protein V4506_01315 [Bacteroidota bacterium]